GRKYTAGVRTLAIAARPIRGFCARDLRFVCDANGECIGLEEWLLRHAAELPETDLPREPKASGVMMIPVPRTGVYENVSGMERARAVDGIVDLTITAREHDTIAAWPEGSSYLRFLFPRAEKPEQI